MISTFISYSCYLNLKRPHLQAAVMQMQPFSQAGVQSFGTAHRKKKVMDDFVTVGEVKHTM